MPANSFFERTRELEKMVGDGDLRGEFDVHKIYAAVQHEKGWKNYLGFMGPRKIHTYHGGGGPKFVEDPLKKHYPGYYQNLAGGVLDGTLREKMAENLKDQDEQLQIYAPERDGELKRAGSWTVYDGKEVYEHKDSETTYEVENPGNPPGFVIGYLKRAGRL